MTALQVILHNRSSNRETDSSCVSLLPFLIHHDVTTCVYNSLHQIHSCSIFCSDIRFKSLPKKQIFHHSLVTPYALNIYHSFSRDDSYFCYQKIFSQNVPIVCSHHISFSMTVELKAILQKFQAGNSCLTSSSWRVPTVSTERLLHLKWRYEPKNRWV